ncbi:MAG: hypothetical protein ACTSQI_20730 [Candidatus Helarchaeota archaeon]
MAVSSLERFGEFLERIIGTSKLELAEGRLKKAYLAEAERNELILNEFKDAFSPRWNFWKRKKGTHMISPFIGEQGPYIFKLWLAFVFPFNYSRLEIGCEKGKSMVDSQGWVKYNYTAQERELIQSVCKKYQISMSEEEVARLLITNAIKSIDPTISNIIETDYRIFIDKIDFSDMDNSLQIHVEFVGRIG